MQARVISNTVHTSGVGEGDSISTLLLNIIIYEEIQIVLQGKGYKIGDKDIEILRYADDATVIAKTEAACSVLKRPLSDKRRPERNVYDPEVKQCKR